MKPEEIPHALYLYAGGNGITRLFPAELAKAAADRISALEAELAEAKKDSERLDFLVSTEQDIGNILLVCKHADNLRDAIDLAIDMSAQAE